MSVGSGIRARSQGCSSEPAEPTRTAWAPILIQLPPTSIDPRGRKSGAEPRHSSWLAGLSPIAPRGVAPDRRPDRPIWRTADWTYLRFHAGRGTPVLDDDLSGIGQRGSKTAWLEASGFVYFNNNRSGSAPSRRERLRFWIGAASRLQACREFRRCPGQPQAPSGPDPKVTRPGRPWGGPSRRLMRLFPRSPQDARGPRDAPARSLTPGRSRADGTPAADAWPLAGGARTTAGWFPLALGGGRLISQAGERSRCSKPTTPRSTRSSSNNLIKPGGLVGHYPPHEPPQAKDMAALKRIEEHHIINLMAARTVYSDETSGGAEQ